MNFFDTHTHIYLKEFDPDRTEAISRAFNAGVNKIVLPNVDSQTIVPMLELSQQFPGHIYSAIGLHPSSVFENFEEELKIIEDYSTKEKFVAIGEIGIDLYWDKTFHKQQLVAFRKQLQLSQRLNLPVIIHIRNAFEDVFKILYEFPKNSLSGIFHCFSGGIQEALKATEMGFYLGIGGVVTFPKAGLQQIVEQIPLEKIVLETDAPYLAPVPYRGKRNEPAYIPVVAEKIAELKKISISDVAEITTQNAFRIFNII